MYAATAGGFMDRSLGEKLFLKLPGKLGQKIRESWNDDQIEPAMNNLTVRIQHIMKIMEDTCTNIAINKQLKLADADICKQIYTPQQYNNRLGEKDPNKNHLLRKDNKLKDIRLGVLMLENLPWIKTSMLERSDRTKIIQSH